MPFFEKAASTNSISWIIFLKIEHFPKIYTLENQFFVQHWQSLSFNPPPPTYPRHSNTKYDILKISASRKKTGMWFKIRVSLHKIPGSSGSACSSPSRDPFFLVSPLFGSCDFKISREARKAFNSGSAEQCRAGGSIASQPQSRSRRRPSKRGGWLREARPRQKPRPTPASLRSICASRIQRLQHQGNS